MPIVHLRVVQVPELSMTPVTAAGPLAGLIQHSRWRGRNQLSGKHSYVRTCLGTGIHLAPKPLLP